MPPKQIQSTPFSLSDYTDGFPGGVVIWVFFLVEFATFALFFLGFAWSYSSEPEVFRHSQTSIDTLMGTLNTMVLLTGSWAAARGILSFRKKEHLGMWFYGAGLSGLVFLGIKSSEYVHVFQEGISLSTNMFWFFYLFLTFFHALHVAFGVGLMFYMNWKAKAELGAEPSDELSLNIEATAVYWHLVDIIWIFLFALIYLSH